MRRAVPRSDSKIVRERPNGQTDALGFADILNRIVPAGRPDEYVGGPGIACAVCGSWAGPVCAAIESGFAVPRRIVEVDSAQGRFHDVAVNGAGQAKSWIRYARGGVDEPAFGLCAR